MTNTLNLKEINQQSAPYASPSLKKSIWQFVITIGAYLGIWALAVFLLKQNISYWYVLPLT
ncbi:MAG: hypothetical protein J7L94_05890, partial [Caldisericaceae bacterium]|nr:hypothetical protein [Caldisericaceae bacterium]